ncbi:uroporphyrinogen-III synthase [Methylobacterium nonmethylotrophicum]|uniref:Uroporphyrinogen-III synthase n=1 Tax=Methylobacterium nonmethylotrophicum TaxID=1141884 RepID=A0A4Z0NJR0_9HYPH|nr:uroporphyrinogen-III synthase [Methylobacterium nonmethylotrophicum]TGD95996.1 uroporphyrinogen-III synthase [Methylobacterium nonmethylotrophicum]
MGGERATRATDDRTALRVWVARPLPAGARTAERVAALGHRPLLAPVLDLAASGAPPPAGPFDALVLTSASAVPAVAVSPLAGLPAYCVGARTAAAARAAGLGPVQEAEGDARALAELIGGALPRGARLLHAAGRERKDEPGDTLAARGYRLTVWVAYAARPLPALPGPVAEALAGGGLDAALHYSRRSAATALGLARAAGREEAFRRVAHHCLSADVAAPLVAAGILSHVVAVRPDEDALLAGLDPIRTDSDAEASPGLRPGLERC